jgi:CBS domain-containing membrane protein
MKKEPYRLTVRHVMSKDVVSVEPDDTLHTCIQRMVDNRVYALPVLRITGECVGIISSSDILQVTRDLDDDLIEMEKADLATGRWLLARLRSEVGSQLVSEIMNEDVATVHADTQLAKAAREMLRNGVHRLPVIDAHEHVIGIVSTSDILAAFVDGAPD